MKIIIFLCFSLLVCLNSNMTLNLRNIEMTEEEKLDKLKELISDKVFPIEKYISLAFTLEELKDLGKKIEDEVRKESIANGHLFLGGPHDFINQSYNKLEIVENIISFILDYKQYINAGTLMNVLLKDLTSLSPIEMIDKIKAFSIKLMSNIPFNDIKHIIHNTNEYKYLLEDIDIPESDLKHFKAIIEIINQINTLDELMNEEKFAEFQLEINAIAQILLANPKLMERGLKISYTQKQFIYEYVLSLLNNYATSDELKFFMMNTTNDEAMAYAKKVQTIAEMTNTELDKTMIAGNKVEYKKIPSVDLDLLSRNELADLVVSHSKENQTFKLISFIRRIAL